MKIDRRVLFSCPYVTACDFIASVMNLFFFLKRSTRLSPGEMRKTASCKRATMSRDWISSLIGQKNIIVGNQLPGTRTFLELARQEKVPRGLSALEVNFRPKILHRRN